MMGTTTDFDLTQTLYLFNWVANAASQHKGDETDLATYVYCSLFGPDGGQANPFPPDPPGLLALYGDQLYGHDWTLAWGPGVYEIDPKLHKADNTAYVLHSAEKDLYVVAIAGTDPGSFLDWWDEDFKVGANNNVNWIDFNAMGPPPTGGEANPDIEQISLSTALGIRALCSQLQVPAWAPNSDKSLGDYLRQLQPASSDSTLIFTGHSLGGALSPTLARWAQENNARLKTVAAMPTAGPTPGNKLYQEAWDKCFQPVEVRGVNGGNQVNYLNQDVWNRDDVVPHGWQYIYTPDYQPAGTPPVTQYYFSNPEHKALDTYDSLHSQLGKLVPGIELRKMVAFMQEKGAGGGMTRAAHTYSFPQQWPMQYLNGKHEVKSLDQPSGPFNIIFPKVYLKFLENLGLIHVWGYGTAAFGIDFSVWTKLRPSAAGLRPD